MKFIDLMPLIRTNHFKVEIIGEQKPLMYDEYMISLNHKCGGYDVINIECSTEVEDESPITHSRAIRPIIVVTIKEA